MQQRHVIDLSEEAADLGGLLAALTDTDWERVTAFKGYTIGDVMRHLHQGDHLALLSIADPEGFQRTAAERRQRREAGIGARESARLEFGHLTGRALLEAWQGTLATLCERLDAIPADTRLKWVGPDMGARMFATARLMEVWAHGQEIWDVLGRVRAPTDRLHAIAVIGVRTFGWTFTNRGLPVPPEPPHVRLVAPSGAIWEWHAASKAGTVTGTALDFCQVVTQVRNVADTALAVSGETAQRWMAIAQCFAGPPEAPPAPGSRRPG